MNDIQTVTLRDLIAGAPAMTRITSEEEAGDSRISWQLSRIERKVMALIGEGSVYDGARKNQLRQHTTLVKLEPPSPDGQTERRVFRGEGAEDRWADVLAEMQCKEVEIPGPVITPAVLSRLKLKRNLTPREMSAAWWMFDEAAFEDAENVYDEAATEGVALPSASLPPAGRAPFCQQL